MKKLLILSTALLVFAACGGKDDAATGSEEAAEAESAISTEEREKDFQEKMDRISEDQNLEVEAINKLDASICEQIRDNNAMETCKLNVLNSRVSITKDASLCDILEDPRLKSECKDSASIHE